MPASLLFLLFLLLCFSAFLLFLLLCFSAFLLFCFSASPASLLFCFFAFLLFLFLCFSAFPAFPASLLFCFSCFFAFLILCFSAVLLLYFSCFFASLLFCFSSFLPCLLLRFSAFLAFLFLFSAILCFLLFQRLCLSCLSVSVPFYVYFSMPSCVLASLLLPTPLLRPFFTVSLLLCFFPFILFCSACFVSMQCFHECLFLSKPKLPHVYIREAFCTVFTSLTITLLIFSWKLTALHVRRDACILLWGGRCALPPIPPATFLYLNPSYISWG